MLKPSVSQLKTYFLKHEMKKIQLPISLRPSIHTGLCFLVLPKQHHSSSQVLPCSWPKSVDWLIMVTSCTQVEYILRVSANKHCIFIHISLSKTIIIVKRLLREALTSVVHHVTMAHTRSIVTDRSTLPLTVIYNIMDYFSLWLRTEPVPCYVAFPLHVILSAHFLYHVVPFSIRKYPFRDPDWYGSAVGTALIHHMHWITMENMVGMVFLIDGIWLFVTERRQTKWLFGSPTERVR